MRDMRGITLIALIITIIILLILAGVSIGMLTGENGILTKANNAKIETAVSAVKENLQLEQMEKTINEEKVTPETLLADGRVRRTMQQKEDGNYYMYYALKESAVEGMQGLGKGNIASLKDVFLIDDNLKVKYIASDGKEYGDNINNKILEDETEIRFSSKAFSEYISKISGATEHEMKFKWMKNQTSLTIEDSSITSLEDLIFFPNLEILTLRYLELDNLDGIENCTKLKNFRKMWGTNIKDYDKLSKLNNLREIHLNQGKTEDFNNFIDSIEKLPNLAFVDIDDCKWIKDITPIKKLNNITELRIGRITISDLNSISKLINLKNLQLDSVNLNNIDGIENLANLETLSLYNNKIENIEKISNLTKLKTLGLGNNNISDITPLSLNVKLTSLDLRGNINIDANRNNYTGKKLEALNKIGEIIDKGGTINLDIDKLKLFTNYKSLNLSNQNLTTLEPLEGLTELTDLNLDGNHLTLEDEQSQKILASMEKLKILYVKNNQIKDLSCINELPNLTKLNATGDFNTFKLKDIENIIPNLIQLGISQTTLNTINECQVENITQLYLYYCNITHLPDLSKFTKLKKLDIRGNNIDNFGEIEKITSLTVLDIGNLSLHGKMINFSRLTNLTRLNLSQNTLWSEDLENLKVLKNNINLTINLNNNSIIDASALLELNSNTKINLTGNVNLSQDSKDKLKARFGNNVTF